MTGLGLPPSLRTPHHGAMPSDGVAEARRTQDGPSYVREWPLLGIEVLRRSKGGDGRTVEAYAAVFDRPAEIHDEHGDYMEEIAPTAFNKIIASGEIRRAECLYNHGYNPITRRPDVVASVPLGTVLSIKAEKKGLLTVTRYNESPLAEAVLAAIKDDQITGQSFEGPCYRSDPMRVPLVRRGQPLPRVRRLELGLRNYGPTPEPAYDVPMVTVVRGSYLRPNGREVVARNARLIEAGLMEMDLVRMGILPSGGWGRR